MRGGMVQSTMDVPQHVPPERVVRFDYRNDPDLLADPAGVLATLSAGPEIVWSPELGGYWIPTRARLVDEVLSRHELFSCRSISIPPIARRTAAIPSALDPPEHGPMRRPISRMFSARVVAGLEPRIRAAARDLAERIAPDGHCLFVDDVARRLPIDAFLGLYGLPLSEREEFVSWVTGFFQGRNAEEIRSAHERTEEYMERWVDAAVRDGADPPGEILPALLDARVDGRPLHRAEVLSIAVTLVNAGLDTVTAAMTNVVAFLARSPGHRRQLVDRPELIPDAVDEMLRRFSVASLAREVDHDMTFHGVEMRRGDMVLACTPLAGLDGERFAEPLAVDFHRENDYRHRPFGAGPHLCPGAGLARMELRVALEELLPRLPEFRVVPGAALQRRSGITLSIIELPLAWDVP